MGAPVWVLSVDLQAKTATFQSGMASAAQSARGSFGQISSGASKMGEEVGRTSGEARHGVMMLGEEFGVHLPRMFQHEPGVLILNRPTTNHKRRYRSIRIPRLVYERVVRKVTV